MVVRPVLFATAMAMIGCAARAPAPEPAKPASERPARPPLLTKEVLRPCPAVTGGKTAGRVNLEVDVARSGRVADVRVLRGIGHGCDEVAQQALSEFVFEPALDANSRPVDSTIRYIYEFRRYSSVVEWSEWYSNDIGSRTQQCFDTVDVPAIDACVCQIACGHQPVVAPPDDDVVVRHDRFKFVLRLDGTPARCIREPEHPSESRFVLECPT